MKYSIGIDSGGTHIVGQAFTTTGEVITEATSGPGNVLLNASTTYQNLTIVLTQIFSKLPVKDCQHILIGIAGVETTGNALEIADQFREQFGVKVDVISDAQLALLNGLEGHDGTLVIAGTGSVVYGRQSNQLFRFGGWGFLLGDTGSAYQITSEAMTSTLKAHDTNSPCSLTEPLLEWLNAFSIKQAVQKYYSLSRQSVAALAVKVAELAENGDSTAIKILVNQAIALADEVINLLQRYQQPIPKKLAFSGSVLVHNKFYRTTLLQRVQEYDPDIQGQVVATNNSRGVIFWEQWQ